MEDAFTTPMNNWQFCMMLLGLSNASATFKAWWNVLWRTSISLKSWHSWMAIIFSETLEDHEGRLIKVLQRSFSGAWVNAVGSQMQVLPSNGYRLGTCYFIAGYMTWCWHIVSYEGQGHERSKDIPGILWTLEKIWRDTQVLLNFWHNL